MVPHFVDFFSILSSLQPGNLPSSLFLRFLTLTLMEAQFKHATSVLESDYSIFYLFFTISYDLFKLYTDTLTGFWC